MATDSCSLHCVSFIIQSFLKLKCHFFVAIGHFIILNLIQLSFLFHSAVPNAKNILVRIGSTKTNKDGVTHKVKRIVQHKKYHSKTIDYDFSLLELEESIEFNENSKPIALPDKDTKLADNTNCLVTGWGDTQSSESRLKLRGAEVPIVNQQSCMDAYKRFGGITPRMVCAGFEKGGKDACQGDSGGPLVAFDNANENPVLVGVVSWGYGMYI